jgi:predicted O-methyltransferase YrrM
MRTPSHTVWYVDRFQVLRHAAALAPEGLILEFGVATGTTLRCLAGSVPLLNRMIYGFDSFKGLPEPWSSYQKGHFSCPIPEVPNNAELIVGMFEDTLPKFLETHKGDVALVHIDCDLYSSTKTVLKNIGSRLVYGSILVLDEFWIETNHEQRAFNEWLVGTNRTCRHEARSIEQLLCVMES